MLKKSLKLFAATAYAIEAEVHRSVIDWERKDILASIEKSAAEMVEELSGSKPEFQDFWGFTDPDNLSGGIEFTYAGLTFEYDGKELSLQ